MIDLDEYVRSVGDVWIIWLGSLLLLACLVYRATARLGWRRLKRLCTDERGASYALPYVLTFPIYLLLVCLMIQATMMLIVKMGTVYAAYAAARSAIVWRSAEPFAASNARARAVAQKNAYRAAAMAMAPFGSGHPEHYRRMFGGGHTSYFQHWFPSTLADRGGWGLYYRLQQDNARRDRLRPSQIIPDPQAAAPRRYVERKARFALRATRVVLDTGPNRWNAPVTARVTYEMPMSIPGAGRILGRPGATRRFYSRFITSTVRLPSETPKSANRRIGIDYDSTMVGTRQLGSSW